jgi:phosphoribosylformimino-5-aminoimidazole carboxamide ribotide isomerase
MTKVFPAIDIIDGKCVRLVKGDYANKTIYSEDPIDMAIQFQEAGATYLHVVDLDAAKDPSVNNREIIANIIQQTQLLVQVGGGIRTQVDVDTLLGLGAFRLIIGSKAVTEREDVYHWIQYYGADKIVIGADVANRMIATHGWLNITNEDIFDFISAYKRQGADTFLCTDISKDGMMSGSSSHLYRQVMDTIPGVSLIASGGVHDVAEVNLLREMNIDSIIIGKAIYEGAIQLSDLFHPNV